MQARAGEALTAQRRRRGLLPAEAAVALEIPTDLIQALENDDDTAFRSALEARAYLRMYAAYLDIDPEPFLLGTEGGEKVVVARSYASAGDDREPQRRHSASTGHALPVVKGPRRLVRRTVGLLIVAAALGALAAALLDQDLTSVALVDPDPSPERAADPPPVTPSPTPATTPTVDVTKDPHQSTESTTEPPDAPRVVQDIDAPPPEETTVQVLDGGGEDRLRAAVDALEAMGYQIVVTQTASRSYDQTTVFFTDGAEGAAEALRARDDRFSALQPNQGLSAAIDLHVVVGRDWPTGSD